MYNKHCSKFFCIMASNYYLALHYPPRKKRKEKKKALHNCWQYVIGIIAYTVHLN